MRELKTLQDALDHLGVEDERDQLSPPTAARAPEHVHTEDPLHQLRVAVAVDGAGRGLARALAPRLRDNVIARRRAAGQDSVVGQLVEARWREVSLGPAKRDRNDPVGRFEEDPAARRSMKVSGLKEM